MAGAAHEADLLGQGAVWRISDKTALRDRVVRAGMDHHRHVDVVPMAAREQLWLAEEELELTLFLAAEALLDIDELLGRDREENDLAGEVIGDADRREAHRRAEHAGDLRVVAAAMRGAGMRVGERVGRGSQAVQFADNGDARTAGFAGDAALDA